MENKIFEVESVTGQVMNVYEDRIELTQRGVKGFLTQGLQGTKTYYFADITTIQFKNCGWTNGFFEFTFAGGKDSRGGAWSGMNNDNRFNFGKPTIKGAKALAIEMEKVNTYLQQQLRAVKTNPTQPTTTNSSADEIKKYKELLDSGIITQEEFDLKKKQLLGL